VAGRWWREAGEQWPRGRWGPTTLTGRPKVAGPFPSMRSVAWVALIAPARGRASKEIANIMHTDAARFLWKPKWPWVKTKPPQPSTTVRAGCNARFLLREVHDSGALTGACTGKGPQMANPRPTPKQNARQLQLCSRPVSRSVKKRFPRSLLTPGTTSEAYSGSLGSPARPTARRPDATG